MMPPMLAFKTADIAIIGAGPAGLTAAWHAARSGANVILLETHAVAGRKLLLTGGGRCNITHDGPLQQMLKAYDEGARFLRFALHAYPPDYLLNILRDCGIATQVEEQNKVFPVKHRAVDIRNVLVETLRAAGVSCYWGYKVYSLRRREDGYLIQTDKRDFTARRVIVATGGLSFPQTGSTGDGFKWARALGHDVIPPKAALVPLVTHPNWPRGLAGLTLEQITIQVELKGQKHQSRGPLVFTDRGIGGPAVLDISRYLTDELPNHDHPLSISIDLLPHLNSTQLRQQWLDLSQAHPRKLIPGLLSHFIPKRLAMALCRINQIAPELWGGHLPKQQRTRLLGCLKSLTVPIVATESIQQATITRGGVSLAQVNPKTMESKVCPGLYFAGELLNIDGPCGGYNLQVCWSTGAVAGCACGAAMLTND